MSTITTTRKDLLALLKRTSQVTTEKGPLPVLGGVRISTHRHQATIEASNLSVWRTLPMTGAVKGRQARVTVVAKHLAALVRTVAAGEELVLDVEADGLALHCSGTTLRLAAIPAEDWPAMPEVTGAELKLSAHDVARMRQIAGAASQDDARPILTGICLAGGYAVATDSYRLAVARVDVDPGAPLLFPAAAAADLPAGGTTVTIDRSTLEVSWWGGDAGEDFHRAHLIEGDFPAWEKLLPAKFKAVAVAEREPLLGVVTQARKTSAALGQPATYPVRLERGDDTSLSVVLKSTGSDTEAMKAAAPCPKVYKAWKTIAFNPEFLAEGLAMLDGEQVRISIVDEAKPAVLRDEADKAGDLLYVLMPVRVS